MTEYAFPRDGSIVIVDDKLEDALPVMQLLSQKGLPFTYYDGSEAGLPEKPIQKIRLAFLDIQFVPLLNSHAYAQNILRLIDRLIPDDNGPYVVILWSSKGEEHGAEVIKQLEAPTNKKRPIAILNLSKFDFMESEFDTSTLDSLVENVVQDIGLAAPNTTATVIERALRDNYAMDRVLVAKAGAIDLLHEKLIVELHTKIDVFQFFTFWENLISKASGIVASQYSSLHTMDSDWSSNFRHILYRMANAQLSKHLLDAPNDIILRNALRTINETFIDVADRLLSSPLENLDSLEISPNTLHYRQNSGSREYSLKWNPNSNDPKKDTFQFFIDGAVCPTGKSAGRMPTRLKQITDQNDSAVFREMFDKFQAVVPDINSKLHLDLSDKDPLRPGSTVLVPNPGLRRKRQILTTYFNASHKLSPTARKTLENGTRPYALGKEVIDRIKMIEMEVSPACDYAQKKIVKHRILPGILVPLEIFEECRGAFYTTPVLSISGEIYRMVLSLQVLKSEDEGYLLDKDPIFRVRKELLSDILVNLSNHIGRLGVTNL